MIAFLRGTCIRLIPCSTPLVTVEREKNTTAADPYIIILIRAELSFLLNKRLQIGPARTVRPTVAGIAMSMEKRITMETLLFNCPFCPSAIALERDGMSAEERELAIATGMLKRS